MSQTMISQFLHTSRLSHLPSILPTVADAYFWLVVVWKFIGMWPLKAMVYFFFFSLLLLNYACPNNGITRLLFVEPPLEYLTCR